MTLLDDYFGSQGKNSTKKIPCSTLRRKAPRTDLLKLKASGLIVDGQLVTMRDHKGNYIPGAKAIIKGKGVVYNGIQAVNIEDLHSGTQKIISV